LTISGKTGGEEMQCGRVKDKFGVSWQIVPANLKKLLHSDNVKNRQM
jgi:predicted 3-demethylubiquinone-9 3-methyltransferase (glyoxalase superfamily)